MWGVGFEIDFSTCGLAVVTGDSDWSLLEDVWEFIEGALLDIHVVVFGGTAWAYCLWSPCLVAVPGLG